MSRLTFRAALETPRPRSALALVVLASLTLAITGQVPLLVLALQAGALAAAAALRRDPRPWQRRGAWLNTGLAVSALLALTELLRGVAASVALAEFALLASGLQLLDARPRRSEFLLVALATFQVVLAASLTDSLLFPPLLMAFLPTCVWTLMVHTLRSEAIEAGDPAAARTVITRGLLGMTLAASAVSLVLALGMFLLLPRLHEGLVRAGTGAAQATSGFSDRVDLGDLGKIRSDPAVMLRVETLSGTPPAPENAYWHGIAFDRFDGRTWSAAGGDRTPVPGDAIFGIALGTARPDLVQRILREPMTGGVVFGAGAPQRLQGPTGRIERDFNSSVYAPQTANARVRYDIAVRSDSPSRAALARDQAVLPRGGQRFAALPELSPAIHALAAEIVAGAPDDAARARALEGWLRSHGRYSDTPPHTAPGDPRSPLERFLLGELRGHCEYFASAMVVLARSVGLPARLVNGFAGGRRNRVGDFVELTGSDAHAWVEVHFRDHGWVRFDPTPPDLRLAGSDSAESLRDQLLELRSALELLWFQYVVEFDRSRQMRAAAGLWHALRRWLPSAFGRDPADAAGGWAERLRQLPAPGVVLVAAIAAAFAIGIQRSRTRGGGPRLPRQYARALRLLARRGFERPPACTPRAFARSLRADLQPAAATAFIAITEAYLNERYGGAAPFAGDAELRTLRDSLRG